MVTHEGRVPARGRGILKGVTHAGRTRTPRIAPLLAIGMMASLVFAALASAAARHGVFALDRSTETFVSLLRRADLRSPMEIVSLLGQASALVPLIALASLVVWRSRRRWALALPLVMAGAGALQFLAKWAVDRPRPNDLPWGFPSGHSLIVVVFFGMLAYLVCTSGARGRWRWASGALCAAMVLAVGFSRLYLDMHWISDVGGGFAVGLAYLPLAVWVVERIPARSSVASD
jgi:membrane-associated phospholipid phosphatase